MPILRSTLKFLKHKFPGKGIIRIDIAADYEDFIKDPEFLHYWRNVLPNERIAYLKGFIDGRKENESQGTDQPTA